MTHWGGGGGYVNVCASVCVYASLIAGHHGAMGAPHAPIVSYAAVQCTQSSPRPATMQRVPEARDWATSLRRGVAPAPTLFLVMACRATQCLRCKSCYVRAETGTGIWAIAPWSGSSAHSTFGHSMSVHTMSVGKS